MSLNFIELATKQKPSSFSSVLLDKMTNQVNGQARAGSVGSSSLNSSSLSVRLNFHESRSFLEFRLDPREELFFLQFSLECSRDELHSMQKSVSHSAVFLHSNKYVRRHEMSGSSRTKLDHRIQHHSRLSNGIVQIKCANRRPIRIYGRTRTRFRFLITGGAQEAGCQGNFFVVRAFGVP